MAAQSERTITISLSTVFLCFFQYCYLHIDVIFFHLRRGLKACVKCMKLDACEELRMSRLVIEGGCGEQGKKALSPNKFKYS